MTTSNLQTTTLDNGLKVLFYKTKNKVTTISLHVRAGEVDSDKDSLGVAHFLEHLILEASKKYPNDQAINFAVNKFGGEINAMVDQEETSFYVNILNKYYKEGIKVIADCIQNPLFLEKDIEKERKVILNEAIIEDEDFDELMQRKLLSKVYTNSPYSISILGSKETIKKISKKEIINFYKKYYMPNNMFLVIVGDIENPFDFVKEQFVFKKSNLNKTRLPVTKKSLDKTIKLKSKLVDSTKGLICYNMPKLAGKDLISFSMFYLVLNDFKGGLLYNKLRNKFGIYDSSASKLKDENHSMMLIDFSIRDEEPEKVFFEINNFFDKLDFKEDEFKDMKQFFKSSVEMIEDESNTLATIFANYELRHLDPNIHLNIAQEIDKITLNDFNKIKDYFVNPHNLILEKEE